MNASESNQQSPQQRADNRPAESTAALLPRWRNVWPGVMVSLLLLQVVTGVALMTVYCPSVTQAWGSVWFIQTQQPMGWLVRGLHHVASDALLIALAAWCVQVVFSQAYRSPHAVAWWIMLALLGLALTAALTGTLLPWDEDGYWGTNVRLHILATIPRVGEALRRFALGGNELGALAITRFYTLHVWVIPVLFALLLFWRSRRERAAQRASALDRETAAKVAARVVGRTIEPADLSRRVSAAPTSPGSESPQTTGRSGGESFPSPVAQTTPGNRSLSYRPGQALRDAVASTLLIAGLMTVAWYVTRVHGSVLLSAPANPAVSDYPARPEWHTLFLFQWLKYFETQGTEVIGAIFVPAAVILMFVMLPLLDRLLGARAGRLIARGVTVLFLLAVAYLSIAAVLADRNPSDERVATVRAKRNAGVALSEEGNDVLAARDLYQRTIWARRRAERAMSLAVDRGIPPEGPLALLADDPMTRGPELFASHCAACHRYNGHDGVGIVSTDVATASDLAGFATRAWVRGLLADPMADRYFGRMKKPDGEPAHTRMARWTSEMLDERTDDAQRRELFRNYDAVAAYLEDESVHPGRLKHLGADATANENSDPASGINAHEQIVRRGRRFFAEKCNECHSYDGYRSGTFNAPEMLGYGSVAWIAEMIRDPSQDARYRSRGREPAQMPSFEDRLSESDRALIARWLHSSRDVSPGRRPTGATDAPISGG